MVILKREGIKTTLHFHDGYLYAASEKRVDEKQSLKFSQRWPLNGVVPRHFLQGAEINSFRHHRGLYRCLHQNNIDAMNATPGGLGPS